MLDRDALVEKGANALNPDVFDPESQSSKLLPPELVAAAQQRVRRDAGTVLDAVLPDVGWEADELARLAYESNEREKVLGARVADLEAETERLRGALKDRRECFVGALADVEQLLRVLDTNLSDPERALDDGFATWASSVLGPRRDLLKRAIEQVDGVLTGEPHHDALAEMAWTRFRGTAR